MFEGDEFEMGKKTKFCGSSDISGDATEEGAARKIRYELFRLNTSFGKKTIYLCFCQKKHYFLILNS